MRLFVVVLALSTIAAAGPLPSFSNKTLEAGAPISISSNITLPNPVAALNKLKAIYDSLNETEHAAAANITGDFWTWLEDTYEPPALNTRSTDLTSVPATSTLDPDSVEALTQLKAIYDSLNDKRSESSLKDKRSFWTWIKDTFKAPGLKARSPDSASTPINGTADCDPLATLTKLKATYDNLNAKRSESAPKDKRSFWTWIKDAFKAPGLKARSLDSAPTPISNDATDSDPLATLTQLKAIYDSLNAKRSDDALYDKRDFLTWFKDAFEAPKIVE